MAPKHETYTLWLRLNAKGYSYVPLISAKRTARGPNPRTFLREYAAKQYDADGYVWLVLPDGVLPAALESHYADTFDAMVKEG